jgi:hypothetical protein
MQQNEEKLKEEIKKRLIKENLQNFVSLVFTNTTTICR